jgi:hypothetical protein
MSSRRRSFHLILISVGTIKGLIVVNKELEDLRDSEILGEDILWPLAVHRGECVGE